MKDCIIVIVSEPVSFQYLEESPSSFIDKEGVEFFSLFDTDNNGFFDWLRSEQREIIGVRWNAYDGSDSELVLDSIADLPNVNVQDNGSICIYFGEETQFIEPFSCDQDFGENNFYKGSDGSYAMSFSTNSFQ